MQVRWCQCLVATFLIAAVWSIGFCGTAPMAEGTTISGQVEHSEKLPAVPTGLKSGAVFAQAVVAPNPDTDWFSIPGWLAGTWQTIQISRISKADDLTGETNATIATVASRERETFGYQLDKVHGIWTPRHTFLPIVSSVSVQTLENEKSAQVPGTCYVTRDNYLISADESKVVLRSVDISVVVRDDKNQIDSVEQRETVRTISPMSGGIIAIASDTQVFDAKGYRKSHERTVEFRMQSRPFQVIDEFAGVSAHVSFAKYLQRTGRIGLTPTGEENSDAH